jgi:thiamine biosynthesis lipoprotein
MSASRAALPLIGPRILLTSLLAIASAHGQTQPAPAPAAVAPAQPALPQPSTSGQWLSRTVDGIMGTRIFVEIWAEDVAAGDAAIDAVMDEMRHIDDSMSTYKPSSEVSRVNALAARRPVRISSELFGLLTTALQYSRITEGAFDITYASVGYMYDFRQRKRPTEQQIAAALPAVNYRHLLLDRKTSSVRFSQPGVRIDLGGIAKGYAVDQGIEILKARGYSHALVNAGGDSRVIGDRRGRPWMVGIRHPDHPDQTITRIPLVDAAFSTSGDYERYFDEDGVRYHHIIDPHTGHSASKVRSATVIASTATRTDGLSKTAFVLGPEAAMKIYNRLDDVDAVLVALDGRILYSRGLTPGDTSAEATPAAGAPTKAQ